MFSIALLIIFLVGMLAIGFWGMKKTLTIGDFFLGSRSIGPWISAFAYGTTYFSAVLFIGFAGEIGWGFGLKGLWIALGNALVGSWLAWIVLGKRTRRMTQNLDAMTMPEFFHERYNDKSLKIIAAITIFVFLIPYSASIFKGLGYLFEANFNIPYDIALLIMIVVTGIYLIMGGYFAVTLADFIQGIIMIVGAIAMVIVLVSKAGGLSAALSTILQNYTRHVPPGKQPSNLLLMGLIFMTSFGVWGMPQMVQKFYAVKNEGLIKKAALVTMVFAVVITFSAYFTGAMSHIFYDKIPVLAGKPAFDRLIPGLLTIYLPEKLMALILLLVLSASMSALSSLILVSASAVTIDLYKGHVNPKISKENSPVMMRFLSAIFVVVSYFIARHEFTLIVTLMSLSWGVIAGSFMAPYIYGLYWKRVTRAGAMAGIFAGMSVAIILFFVMGPDKSPIASSIAMIVPFVVIPVVTVFTKPLPKDAVERAFKDIK